MRFVFSLPPVSPHPLRLTVHYGCADGRQDLARLAEERSQEHVRVWRRLHSNDFQLCELFDIPNRLPSVPECECFIRSQMNMRGHAFARPSV